ncbi:hypothetical protein MJO29_016123 [Puccinia striiformis f. sp. tritici]|nr:hypothetical protein MJO29_016123 [Puccinia striiformis f. sp. tritici]
METLLPAPQPIITNNGNNDNHGDNDDAGWGRRRRRSQRGSRNREAGEMVVNKQLDVIILLYPQNFVNFKISNTTTPTPTTSTAASHGLSFHIDLSMFNVPSFLSLMYLC